MLIDTASITDEEYEIARKAVEDLLVDLRDSHIFAVRNNGFAIRDYDGTPSGIIRLPTEHGIKVALAAIVEHRQQDKQKE